ncbi:MAG TPA: PIG-L deacetylase family protein [Fimbriimonas sp.]
MSRRVLRRIGYFALGVAGAVSLFWWWQPWDYDLVPRVPKEPLAPVDPDSDRLFAKGTKVMVITAHPDDEAFYNGGTLAKLRESGVRLAFVLITDGDKAYYGPFTDQAENRRVRRAEVRELGEALSTDDIVFLGYPDGRLRDTEEVRQKVAREIERFQPDYIMAFEDQYPWRFSHSDHRRAGESAVAAAKMAGFGGWLLLFQTNAPNFRVDVTPYWDEKREFLAIHRSQFNGDKYERIEGMVRGRAVREGSAMGVELAEGFRAVRLSR